MDPYRVFVSYSHDDLPLAEGVVSILEANGLSPMWDRNFAFGHGFHEQIRDFIAFSHVFLPIVTETSSRRGWVHQEIGYAMALNVPVLPVAAGVLPGQMIERLHAVRMGDDVESLRAPLSRAVFEQLVQAAADPLLALSQCAAEQEDRSLLTARYARGVLRLGAHVRVRARGGLSAFSIPDRPVGHPHWKARYGNLPRSVHQCELLREERLSLGEHAVRAGCSVILDLSRSFDRYIPSVRVSRLKILRDFLASMPDELVRAAVTSIPPGESVLIVGNWFSAQSLSGTQGGGSRQTVFVRHAPNLCRRIEDFDAEMDDLLSSAGVAPQDSRRAVIEHLDRVIAECGRGHGADGSGR